MYAQKLSIVNPFVFRPVSVTTFVRNPNLVKHFYTVSFDSQNDHET